MMSDVPSASSEDSPVKIPMPEDIHFINFNQDFSSLCLGTSSGYQIYDFGKQNELTLSCNNQCDQSSPGKCIIVQRLYSSSLVAVVSENQPRKLTMNHSKKNSHICSYTYVQSVLNVLLNRERLVVVCEDRLSIHVVKDMELIHTISDTPSNPSGLCALANSTTNCFLAYPASATEGSVQIFHAFNLRSVVMISAHDNPLQCLAFSDDGTKLATASTQGTVIRVFSTTGESAGAKLLELRRGTRAATIYSLAFSMDSQFLLASSNMPTIHVFRLQPPQQEPKSDGSYVSTMYSIFNTAMSASAAYLPNPVAGIMVQDRAFAWATLPSTPPTTKGNPLNRVALTVNNKIPRIVVATLDGMVYVYSFDHLQGGESKLISQHNLHPHQEKGNLLPVDLSGPVSNISAACDTSYADALKGASSSTFTEMDRTRELFDATRTPFSPIFDFDDDVQFPSVTRGSRV